MPVKRKLVPSGPIDDSTTTSVKKPKIPTDTKKDKTEKNEVTKDKVKQKDAKTNATKKKDNIKNDEKKDEKVYSVSDKMLNTSKLLFMLMEKDLKDLTQALKFVESIGPHGFDLLNVPGRKRGYVIDQMLKSISHVALIIKTDKIKYNEQRKKWDIIINQLLNTLWIDPMNNNMLCCYIAKHRFWIKCPFKSVSIEYVPVGEEHGIVQIIQHVRAKSYIIPAVSICTDSYLNIVSPSTIPSETKNKDKQLMTPLKAAVQLGMYDVIDAIVRRFPSVDFDVIHPTLPLAEPLRLSLPLTHEPLTNLIHVGESIVQSYYENLQTLILSLKNGHCLPNPDLLNIIWSYAQRMPLSTTFLTWPSPSHPPPPVTTTLTTT